MNNLKKLNLIGQGLLLFCAVVWGSAFIVLKDTLDVLPTFFILAIRFLISGILLFLIFIKNTTKAPKKTYIHGIILGLILALAYIVQTIGLKYTTPARNAFITSVYCVLVPLIMWVFYKSRPKSYNVVGVTLCVIGVVFISLIGDKDDAKNKLLGDIITLGCTIFYALQIVFINNYNKEKDDTFTLLSVELLTVGVICLVVSLFKEIPSIEIINIDVNVILKLVYLTFICTLLPQLFMIVGQKHTSVNQASILLSLECVFATLFSVIAGKDKLTFFITIGFVIVFIGMLINELEVDFPKLLNKNKKD